MTNDAHNFGTEFFLALDKIGASSLTDEQCCQLLAWMHDDRGCSEAPVHNWALNRDIKVAQHRLNIYGGQIPNGELISLFNQFREELENAGDDKPDWYTDILTKYNLQK
jgi:hypothetical protein